MGSSSPGLPQWVHAHNPSGLPRAQRTPHPSIAACPGGLLRPLSGQPRACTLTMLPPTDAKASDSLGEKPAPHSCREKMLGTRVCFTSESKKGSKLSSGWGGESQSRDCLTTLWSP